MALVELTVARVKKAAEKLPAPGSEEYQLDVAIRNSAEKNRGGKITVPSQLAERVDALLGETPVATQLPPVEQPIVDEVHESDDEPVAADPSNPDEADPDE